MLELQGNPNDQWLWRLDHSRELPNSTRKKIPHKLSNIREQANELLSRDAKTLHEWQSNNSRKIRPCFVSIGWAQSGRLPFEKDTSANQRTDVPFRQRKALLHCMCLFVIVQSWNNTDLETCNRCAQWRGVCRTANASGQTSPTIVHSQSALSWEENN